MLAHIEMGFSVDGELDLEHPIVVTREGKLYHFVKDSPIPYQILQKSNKGGTVYWQFFDNAGFSYEVSDCDLGEYGCGAPAIQTALREAHNATQNEI